MTKTEQLGGPRIVPLDGKSNLTLRFFADGNGLSLRSQPPTSRAAARRSTRSKARSGSSTWSSSELYALGSQGPQDNVNWGVRRVAVPEPVPPAGQTTFSFVVTAPSTPGNYYFQWQMVQNGAAWFGDLTPPIYINVAAPPATPRCVDLRGKPIQ